MIDKKNNLSATAGDPYLSVLGHPRVRVHKREVEICFCGIRWSV